MFDPDEWLEIGKIVAPQGLHGEMRVYPNTDFPERFLTPGERWLSRAGTHELETVTLLSGRFLEGKGLYVIRLEGITNRDQAESLRNSRMWVPASDRPPLEDGEFHVADLIGLPVYDQATGEQLGTVKDILPAGNDLLEVERIPVKPPNSTHQDTPVPPEVSSPSKSSRRKTAKPKTKDQQPTVLIPFVYEIVPIVDLENRRIEVVPPPGLIEP